MLSTGGSAPYGQVLPVRPKGPASSQQPRLHPLVATGFGTFLDIANLSGGWVGWVWSQLAQLTWWQSRG